MFLKNLYGNFWKNFQKRGLWYDPNVYIMYMNFLLIYFLVSVFIVVSLFVGEWISEKKPNSGFTKWWKDYIVSEEEDDKPLN